MKALIGFAYLGGVGVVGDSEDVVGIKRVLGGGGGGEMAAACGAGGPRGGAAGGDHPAGGQRPKHCQVSGEPVKVCPRQHGWNGGKPRGGTTRWARGSRAHTQLRSARTRGISRGAAQDASDGATLSWQTAPFVRVDVFTCGRPSFHYQLKLYEYGTREGPRVPLSFMHERARIRRGDRRSGAHRPV